MLPACCRRELRSNWLPHITDDGLVRLTELLEMSSPLLIHGAFINVMPMGCLASHIAWHHPQTAHFDEDAGIMWLSRIAQLNPATSRVILEWDRRDRFDWQFRSDLLAEFQTEIARRSIGTPDSVSTSARSYRSRSERIGVAD